NDYANMTGIIVLKGGSTAYERYFNGCTADTAIHVFSVTKSVVSALIGIAVDKGFIKSTEQKVLEFFPDYTIKRGEKTIQGVSIKTMLTMTAPYKYKSAPYTRYFTSDNWVKIALDLLGGKKPIGEFRYAPVIGPDILSGILVKATGQSVLDFAKEHLFTPLGIAVASNVTFADKEEQLAFYKAKGISGWVADPKGINTAGWGLTLTAMDMAKIGQLYLNGGKWNGWQIVSTEWIDESLKEHSRWETMNLPYGYLWWVGIGNGYAAMGDGGNVIYVNPNKEIVVSIASLFKPTAKDRIEFIMEYIEPMFENQT
ncbi:MAG TPA: serine hydrolase, partial [Ruminococcaceae bacterium]|nr:serine hydrolase [Oscillospiraceae bacterium]